MRKVFSAVALLVVVGARVQIRDVVARDDPPSTVAAMGAATTRGGVSFRVWAPNATQVTVAGTFNGWSTSSNTLVKEGGGNWSTTVAGAKAGDEYKFVIIHPTA